METPLDVLSRAASLVETNEAVRFAEKQDTENDLSTNRMLKQRRQDFGAASSKYRDHRTAGTQTSMSMMNNSEGARQNNKRARLENLKQELQNSYEDDDSDDDDDDGGGESNDFCDDDSPLDMTTTNRNSSSNKSSGVMLQQRPSVIQCASTLFNHDKPTKDFGESRGQKMLSNRYSEIRHGHRREILSGMCDPVIDEHFRRSLGKDYPEYFSTPPVTNSVSISGLSVDDHFAKALGEKWHQIQGKIETADSKSSSTSNTNITTQASSPLVQQRQSILST